MHCSLKGDETACQELRGSDYTAVKAGKISLTALPLHPAVHAAQERYEDLIAGERISV
jgi:hypothetical protein